MFTNVRALRRISRYYKSQVGIIRLPHCPPQKQRRYNLLPLTVKATHPTQAKSLLAQHRKGVRISLITEGGTQLAQE